MRPPKPPTGGQAVTAQLIVVSIWAAGKGRSSVHGCRESHGKEPSWNEHRVASSHLMMTKKETTEQRSSWGAGMNTKTQFSSSSSPASPRTKVVLQSHQFSSSSSPDTPRTKVVLQRHDLRRGFPASRVNRALAYISRTRHARSPQRVARTPDKSHSRLHFAHSTRAISACLLYTSPSPRDA